MALTQRALAPCSNSRAGSSSSSRLLAAPATLPPTAGHRCSEIVKQRVTEADPARVKPTTHVFIRMLAATALSALLVLATIPPTAADASTGCPGHGPCVVSLDAVGSTRVTLTPVGGRTYSIRFRVR